MDTFHFENIHHTHDQEEEEETLSLSDWERDVSSQESKSFSSEDDFFEFFSQEYFNPSPPAGIPPENIIFCGKLIHYKQPYRDAESSLQSRKQEAHTKKDLDCGVSRWNFGSSNSSTSERCIDSKNDKTRAILLTSLAQKKVKDLHVSSSPLRYSPKKVKGCDFQGQKYPVMASSSSGKAKWYLFFFGMSRLPSAMELNGINSRRSRRQYPPLVFTFRSGDKNISDDRDRGWRMGRLLGALSCGGHRHADTMVAASIGRPALK